MAKLLNLYLKLNKNDTNKDKFKLLIKIHMKYI